MVQLWCPTRVSREELCNWVFYKPVGANLTQKLTPFARDNELARKLWDWAEKVLTRFDQAADMMQPPHPLQHRVAPMLKVIVSGIVNSYKLDQYTNADICLPNNFLKWVSTHNA